MSNVLQLKADEKVCTKCGETKPFSSYEMRSDSKKLRAQCIDCRKISHKNWRIKQNSTPEGRASYLADKKAKYLATRVGIEDGRKNVKLIDGGRVCVKCGIGKLWDEFPKDNYGYNSKSASCKLCRNSSYKDPRGGSIFDRPDKVKRLYGVTLEHVIRTLDSQHGRCANRACGKEISLYTKGVGGNRAVIDHDHETGKFRALLCSPCNTILGTLETRENIILGLIEYQHNHKHKG